MADALELGDVICIHGGDGVPKELESMWYRVVEASVADGCGAWRLDGPYLDKDLTQPYRPKPRRRK